MIIMKKPAGREMHEIYFRKEFKNIINRKYFSISIFVYKTERMIFRKFYVNSSHDNIKALNNKAVLEKFYSFVLDSVSKEDTAMVVFAHREDSSLPGVNTVISSRDIGASVYNLLGQNFYSNIGHSSVIHGDTQPNPKSTFVFAMELGEMKLNRTSLHELVLKYQSKYQGNAYSMNDILSIDKIQYVNIEDGSKSAFEKMMDKSPLVKSLNSSGIPGFVSISNDLHIINEKEFININGFLFSSLGDYNLIKKKKASPWATTKAKAAKLAAYIYNEDILVFKDDLLLDPIDLDKDKIIFSGASTDLFLEISLDDLDDIIFLRTKNIEYQVSNGRQH